MTLIPHNLTPMGHIVVEYMCYVDKNENRDAVGQSIYMFAHIVFGDPQKFPPVARGALDAMCDSDLLLLDFLILGPESQSASLSALLAVKNLVTDADRSAYRQLEPPVPQPKKDSLEAEMDVLLHGPTAGSEEAESDEEIEEAINWDFLSGKK